MNFHARTEQKRLRRKVPNERRHSFIYLILTEEVAGFQYVKVGMSDHPEKRVTSHATSCPLSIISFHTAEFIGRANAYRAEKTILRKLAHLHCKGEWLRAEKDGDIDVILCAAKDVAPHLAEVPVIQK